LSNFPFFFILFFCRRLLDLSNCLSSSLH
jgi:hypothetical protein